MTVRALFAAAKVEEAVSPYDTLHLKIYYPAQQADLPQKQTMGMLPADRSQAPFKVVILFNGINCGPELYQWLAVKLADRGLVVVTFSWVAENLPGVVALTPGVDITRLSAATDDASPTASALPTLLTALEKLNSQGILAGLLDLQTVILGGHSAGGRVAIESANPKFFPQVVAAFAYGAHTTTFAPLGYPPGTMLPLPDVLPLMLIGGTCDGVIANSSDRYGVTWEQPITPIVRTFQEAIAGGRGDSYLLILEGANHFSFTFPLDTTTGISFLDFPARRPETELRELMAEAIGLFIDAHITHQSTALAALNQLCTARHPAIARFECK